jgi:hypothetical protein
MKDCRVFSRGGAITPDYICPSLYSGKNGLVKTSIPGREFAESSVSILTGSGVAM